MADSEISNLPAATSVAAADVFPIVQGGDNKQAAMSAVADAARASGNILFLYDYSEAEDAADVTTAGTKYGPTLEKHALGSGTTASGFAIPTSDDTVYFSATVDENIRACVIEFALDADTNGPTIAMGEQATLAVGSLHLNINRDGCVLQARFAGGASDLIGGPKWLEILPADGRILRVTLGAYGNTAYVIGPNGEVFSWSDPRINGLLGGVAYYQFHQDESDNYPKVRRFYGLADGLASEVPTDHPTALMLSARNDGEATLFAGTPAEMTFDKAPYFGARILFGPELIVARIVAPISASASSFSCEYPLPNGSYYIDPASDGGANIETVTVNGVSGSGPYTVTISGTFANAHAAHAVGAPVVARSASSRTRPSIRSDFDSRIILPNNATIDGAFVLGTSFRAQISDGGSSRYGKVTSPIDGELADWGCSGVRMKEGSNAKMGTATLVAGEATVSTTAVTANSRILLTGQADGGTPGAHRVSTRTAGTSFTIKSTEAADTSTVAWVIFEPA